MTLPRTKLLPLGIAALGMLTLAGCAVETATAGTTTDSSAGGTSSETSTTASGYTDGTYTAEAGYQAPSGTESITVELTVADGTVTAVTVTGDASDRQAQQYQSQFSAAISGEVVGKDLATLSVSRVAGSSLTSGGFNSALDEIRSQAE